MIPDRQNESRKGGSIPKKAQPVITKLVRQSSWSIKVSIPDWAPRNDGFQEELSKKEKKWQELQLRPHRLPLGSSPCTSWEETLNRSPCTMLNLP